MTHRSLILASTSPYRRQLLERLQLQFEVFNPDVDEQRLDGESASDLVQRLAIAKAKSASSKFDSGLVIGSDQLCQAGDAILGKPDSYEAAVMQLQSTSGKQVCFLTGLCLYNIEADHYQVCIEPFKVHFRTLTLPQIEYYLRAEQPYNCAGSFKSEGLGIALFEKMLGDDPNALVGLPLIRLVKMLQNEGIDVLNNPV